VSERPDSATTSPGFQMWLAMLAWQRSIVAALRPYDLTHVQFVLLAGTWWLSEERQSPTQRELAQHTGTDPMMASQVLRRLERKGHIGRVIDTADARAKRVRLTATGQTLLRRALPAVEKADTAFFAPVDRSQLMDCLKRLNTRREDTA
jgi:DNA-binding MarR family transcriptional regulator